MHSGTRHSRGRGRRCPSDVGRGPGAPAARRGPPPRRTVFLPPHACAVELLEVLARVLHHQCVPPGSVDDQEMPSLRFTRVCPRGSCPRVSKARGVAVTPETPRTGLHKQVVVDNFCLKILVFLRVSDVSVLIASNVSRSVHGAVVMSTLRPPTGGKGPGGPGPFQVGFPACVPPQGTDLKLHRPEVIQTLCRLSSRT